MVYEEQFPTLSFFKDYALPSAITVDNTSRLNYQSHFKIEIYVHDCLVVLNNERPLSPVFSKDSKQIQLPILIHQNIFYISFGNKHLCSQLFPLLFEIAQTESLVS